MPGQRERGARTVRAQATRHPFEYALVRVVPALDRGERINAGVIVHSRPHRYLAARISLDRDRLRAIGPACDPDVVETHLRTIEQIANGDLDGGPIAALSRPERFHWLVAPSSTIIQPSRVHTGLTADPGDTLDHLFGTLVLAPPDGAGRDGQG